VMRDKKALGIDIGNVIINTRMIHPMWSKVAETIYAVFPPTPGVFDAVKYLTHHFKGKIYIISKCNVWTQVQVLLWLKAHRFYERTGVKIENIHFVRQRCEKVGVCRTLGITHFIDDRLEVLSHMTGIVPSLFLFAPNMNEIKKFESSLQNVTIVYSWTEILTIIK
jgi:hypothetical protein